MKLHTTLAAASILLAASSARAADWTQFRGPNRDGKSTETGLLREWPENGPRLLWSVDGLGTGFASVAVVDGCVYTTGLLKPDMQGYIFCCDPLGNIKWKQPYGPGWNGPHPGTRTTPTVDGDRLYIMTGHGRIACHDRDTGKQLWKIDTEDVFKARNIRWGISESPLIYGDIVICTPGGENATMVAVNKMTGQTVWTTKGLSEKSAYCSPVLVKAAGKNLILTNVQKSIIFVDPADGNVVLRIPHEKRHDLAAVSPVFTQQLVYVTTGYTRDDFPDRGRAFAVAAELGSYELKWTDRNLDCHHGGLILLDGCVHGSSSAIYPPASNEKPKGNWYCLNLATGKIKYEAKLVGKGSVIFGDGLLYCYGENGTLSLVRPGTHGYELISSFQITTGSGEHWAHPAISDGKLYIRHGGALMAYDIKSR